MNTGILLMAHGSREAEANADLVHVAESLRSRGPHALVEAAFLELAQPNIEQGAELLVERGAERIVMLPYFLSAGTHFRRDLTALRDRLAMRFPKIAFFLAEPLGRHPLLVEVVADRVAESLR